MSFSVSETTAGSESSSEDSGQDGELSAASSVRRLEEEVERTSGRPTAATGTPTTRTGKAEGRRPDRANRKATQPTLTGTWKQG